ncbi:ABC transporter ATP-binding protein [Xylocopilactobacillus apicola]|uniref:ABC transporter ATP-binding protein n=1 Tax=Xylocopilactobacillus apicola TaxID=2932184 RepID=A0AAU9DSQ7_9LACO|nr:ABC transporter ATP-binding protein [Xylocopilactobacillus apicola]BDR59104.1 ABC transporter ATP-binding protein [Xylocopilactobacillus apicola]
MIKMNNISKSYILNDDETPLYVLKDINLNIEEKEFTAIMGPSGSGKSTLINIISFLDRAFEGEYYFSDEDVKEFKDNDLSTMRNRNVGFVFQSFNLIETDTIYENVELPLLYRGATHRCAKPIVLEQLDKVGLLSKKDQLPSQLSGGQKQRVAIARALANKPKFIVADEPTGALDSKTSDEIMTLFQELNNLHDVTILMVTHDPEAARYCKRVVEVKDGQVIG